MILAPTMCLAGLVCLVWANTSDTSGDLDRRTSPQPTASNVSTQRDSKIYYNILDTVTEYLRRATVTTNKPQVPQISSDLFVERVSRIRFFHATENCYNGRCHNKQAKIPIDNRVLMCDERTADALFAPHTCQHRCHKPNQRSDKPGIA